MPGGLMPGGGPANKIMFLQFLATYTHTLTSHSRGHHSRGPPRGHSRRGHSRGRHATPHHVRGHTRRRHTTYTIPNNTAEYQQGGSRLKPPTAEYQWGGGGGGVQTQTPISVGWGSRLNPPSACPVSNKLCPLYS